MGLYATAYDALWRLETRMSGSKSVQFCQALQASQYYPPEQIQAIQWRKLQALLAHAYENVPFYRQRFDQIGAHPMDIRTPTDFAQVPPLTRADLKNHQAELIARNINPNHLIRSSTGGSTGKPVHFHMDRDYHQWVGAILRVQDSWTGLRRGEPHAFLWGANIDLNKQKHLKPRIINRLKRNLFLDCFHMDEHRLRAYVQQLITFKPKLLTGYVLGLQTLARFIQQQGLPVPAIGAVQTGAEPLREHQRSIIAEGLNAPVFERYAGRDIGVIAHECEVHRGMHIFAFNYYVESMRDGQPAQPGEPGELLITQFDNYGAPFIRYRSEDLGVISTRACSCGRTYPMLERVEGRILDLIVGENGRLLPGEFFPHFFKDFDIGEFQVIQKRCDLLQIKLVRGRGFTQEHRQNIESTIQDYLGPNTKVQIDYVDTIPRTTSGKFRVTISEVTSKWCSHT